MKSWFLALVIAIALFFPVGDGKSWTEMKVNPDSLIGSLINYLKRH